VTFESAAEREPLPDGRERVPSVESAAEREPLLMGASASVSPVCAGERLWRLARGPVALGTDPPAANAPPRVRGPIRRCPPQSSTSTS